MYSTISSQFNSIADSGALEVLIEDYGLNENKRYEEFLEELQEVASADHAKSSERLESFISLNAHENPSFWSKGLLRIAEAQAETDPFDFFDAFLPRAPNSLQKLLYASRDYFDGYTLLHLAVHRGNPKLAKLLSDECVSFSRNCLLSADDEEEGEGEKDCLFRTKWVLDFIHARTFRASSTALHMAVTMGDAKTAAQLTAVYDELEIPSYMVWNFLDKAWMTPLHYAVLQKNEAIVKSLLQCKAFGRHVNVGDWSMRTALHVACSAETEGAYSNYLTLEIIEALLSCPHVDVNALDCCRFTPLHWAVYVRSIDVVKKILSKAGERTIRTTEEDYDGRTVLQHALTLFNPSSHSQSSEIWKQFYPDGDEFGIDGSKGGEFQRRGKDVERLLLDDTGVKGEVERLYRDRQVYVDAANAMLVGAALIASVTFGGWLQVPGAGGDRSSRRETRVFWAFNSLSFFFAIASVMAGAGAVLPMANMYIGDGVTRVRDWLALTAFLLLISVICVLGSFIAAGYSSGSTLVRGIFPHMTVTSLVGGILCILIGVFFMRGLYHIRPGWTQLLWSMRTSRSFQKAENEVRNNRKLKAYMIRIRKSLRCSWHWLRGGQAKERISVRHSYVYEELEKRTFDRALRLLKQNGSKYWTWLRMASPNLKKRLEKRVSTSFQQAYEKLKKDCDRPEKREKSYEKRGSRYLPVSGKPVEKNIHEQILQWVNDECPPGFRKTSLKTSTRSHLNRLEMQVEDIDELLEELVVGMVTQCSGRGLLHIFLDLPTESCRNICLRNNMKDFRMTPFSGS
ncbi:hypothetical protein R1flu_012188 [Riccia fluitans]|uniref:PGG domain-containing protein n=1 Tax=Riccia fluitans TaxID=41844 RepID=A0ABD1Z9Y2_9MARC